MQKARDFLAELEEPMLPYLPEVTEQPSALLLKPLERAVIEAFLEGSSEADIALRLALPRSTITAILSDKVVQEELRVAQEALNDRRLARISNILDSIVEARVEEFENASESSKKDLADLLKIHGDLLIADRKSRKPDAEQNTYINILSQVMEK